MTTDLILTHQDNEIFYITLNRVAKRNAITIDMLTAIANAVRHADAHPEIRAIILQAEGPIFSAGIDVMALMQTRALAGNQNPARWLRRLAAQLQQDLNAIEATELPVIAAMQGQVIGLGLELVLACDFRVVTDDCQLSIPEAKLGLVADVGGTTRLTKLIGPGRAKDMLMTARRVSADEGLAWGLVSRVVPADSLLDTAVALAEQIGQNAPLAVGMAKLLVNQGLGVDATTQMALERWAQSQLIDSEDVGEAVAAFMQKRPPQFKGR